MAKALKKMDTVPLSTTVMVRQPIYDKNLKVTAYQVICKNTEEAINSLLTDSETAIHVVLEEYTSVYESGQIQCLPAYIHLAPATASMLRGISDGNNIVVELDAGLRDEKNFLSVLEHLTEQGFKIALANHGSPDCPSQFLDLADVVSMDLHGLSINQIEAQVSQVRNRSDLQILAENIDSVELLEACVELGFDLFHGQFLNKPKVVSEGKFSANQTAILKLISELQKPDASPKSIEQIVQVDPVLTFRLMRIVNSTAYSLVRKVTCIADTIVMLGLDQVRQLAIVITTGNQSDKPMEMYRSMLMRGHMCEVIARQNDSRNSSSYFLAGIMSVLYLLLDTTPENLLKQLPVTDDVQTAVLDDNGSIGEVLKSVRNYEKGNWVDLPTDIDINQYEYAYMEAIRWTNGVMGSTI